MGGEDILKKINELRELLKNMRRSSERSLNKASSSLIINRDAESRYKKLHLKYKEHIQEIKKAPDIFAEKPVKLPKIAKEEKEYILIIQLYNEKKVSRANEFITSLEKNLSHPRIKEIVIFYDGTSAESRNHVFFKKIQDKALKFIYKPGRLTYKHAFEFANKNYPKQNIIVANADIYFNETLGKLDYVDLLSAMIALTRWNMMHDGSIKLAFLEKHPHKSFISQDVWIFKTPLKIDFRCEFEMGLNHCDSFLNYHMLKSLSLKILNPCLDIQAIHYHLSDYRSPDLVALAKRNMEYVDEQAKLGNFDAGVQWQYLEFDDAENEFLAEYNFKTKKELDFDTELVKCTDAKKLPDSN